MDWNVNDRFFISGVIQLECYSPRVHAKGIITELLHNKKARVILDEIDGEKDVEAIVHIRDLRPVKR